MTAVSFRELGELVGAVKALAARVERLELLARTAGIETEEQDTVAAGFALYRARAKAKEREG